jgi:L-alanine-DL-glutamate epimerase-like enolase superfamily enzyme
VRIESIRTYQVSKPLTQPLTNSLFSIERMEHVLIEMDAGGHTGFGFVYAVDVDQARAIKAMVDGFARVLVGEDSDLIRLHWNRAQTRINAIGQTGLPIVAWAGFDTALWDLMAKQAGLPLYKLLGACRSEVPVYASGGWLIPLEELIREALNYKAQGFRHYKMKVGCADYREDLRRIEKVRDALGDGIELMIDANQGWTVKRSIALAPRLLEMGVTYLEEPVHAQDYAGQAEIRKSTAINIAAGESLFTLTEVFELVRNRCVDIVNPDLQRCGGISEFLQVCALANAYRIPVTSHLFTEASAHLLAAAPTGLHVEWVPDWWRGIFTEEPDIADGMLRLSNRPGLGVAFDHDFIEDHAA